MRRRLITVLFLTLSVCSCDRIDALPTMEFEKKPYLNLSFSPYANTLMQVGGSRSYYSTLTYFQGYDDRGCLDGGDYRKVPEESARDLYLLEHDEGPADVLGFYLPEEDLALARECLMNNKWADAEYTSTHLNASEGDDYLDGRLYWGADMAGVKDNIRMASFASFEEIPVECTFGSLILVMDRNRVVYKENLFTGETLEGEAPVVARRMAKIEDGRLVEAEVPNDDSWFSYSYRLERSGFLADGPFLEPNLSVNTWVRQCPRMSPVRDAFTGTQDTHALREGGSRITLRRYLYDGTDLLMSEFDESIAVDPYGELRPAWREAFIEDRIDSPLFADFSFDVIRPYLLKTD